jgi:hypothetical protein
MKLRFEVDQAECFRKGIDCPKSIVTIEVDPAKLPQAQRDLIAERLNGIDVFRLDVTGLLSWENGVPKLMKGVKHEYYQTSTRVKAAEPTLEALLDAVEADAKKMRQIGTLVQIEETEDTPEAFTEQAKEGQQWDAEQKAAREAAQDAEKKRTQDSQTKKAAMRKSLER